MHDGGRLGPVDATILRLAPSEITSRFQVERRVRRGAREQRRQYSVQGQFGGDRHLVENFARRVVGQNRHRLPGDDLAGIRLVDHAVQGGAGFPLTVDQRPVHRCPAAVLGQQRAMHVVGAARDGQQGGTKHQAVVEGEEEIGSQGLHPSDELGRAGILGRDDGDAVVARQIRHPLEPQVLRRIVRVADHQGHVDAMREQHPQATGTDVVVGEDDGAGGGAHSPSSSTASIR